MLCTDEKTLADHIVEVLAEFPLCTAYELQDIVDERERHYTIQAVYQELRKLERLHVVMKVQDKFMLRVGWIERVAHLMEELQSHYIEHSPFEELLPEEGIVEFKVKSLQRAVRVSSRLLTTLLNTIPNSVVYQHLQHIWFHLIFEDESKYIDAVKKGKHRHYMNSVHNTFLDRMYKRTFPEMPVKVVNGGASLSEKKDYHAIVEPYIVRTYISPKLKSDLSNLFHAVKGAKDISPGQITELVTRKSPIRITLEKNEAKAAKYAKKMRAFFGVED